MIYPKRLIEVDLPIARISTHARREKSIRHGHISTLHIWWARRPLAACRAVICAALWPDPADPNCPQRFRDDAASIIAAFAEKVVGQRKIEGRSLRETASLESIARWEGLVNSGVALNPSDEAHQNILRFALLDFIADFANWDNSTVPAYLESARALTQAAHEALGGAPGTRPLVVDPFAGGGSIPLEALRVGADAFASDLNPVPVLLNKVILEYIPKYGQRLVDEVRKWGDWIKHEAEKELAEFYPKDADGAMPIAYLWARTIQCEGPGCGADLPLIRSLWLAKKANRSVALQVVPNRKAKRVDFQIIVKQRDEWVDQSNLKTKIDNPKFDGTVKRGSATCPCCGYTTPVVRVREQLRVRRGGSKDARLLCVVTTSHESQGRSYRLQSIEDLGAIKTATEALEHRKRTHIGQFSLIPNEPIPRGASREGGGSPFTVFIYGIEQWGDLFTPRQLLSLTTLTELVRNVARNFEDQQEKGFSEALQACLAMVVNKLADKSSSLCRWKSSAEYMAGNTFSRQALPMVLDFCEANLFGGVTGDISSEVGWLTEMLVHVVESRVVAGHVERCSATQQTLPDDSTDALITDPPYYDAVPYADLSDFFFVWIRRSFPSFGDGLEETPKADECIVDHARNKNRTYFERQMSRAMSESRRVLAPSGVGIVVFAHKSTSGWEAQLQAMIDAGWIITGSWPIDTEMGSRLRAMDSAALASSVHLVCRPRENPDGLVRADEIGDWRDVLQELPRRIHEWMPRLAGEGVVGADAIFACLGPALEIFSRYSRVEKASGEVATLREYLEHVWAAVSTEALSMIFRDADAAGLEPDARLTAMWLWTLAGGKATTNGKPSQGGHLPEGETEEDAGEDEESTTATAKNAGYSLEFDAARRIAQGLGIHLEKSESIVEVKGETARLLPVAERTRYLFGRDADHKAATGGRGKKPAKQKRLFEELGEAEAAEAGWTELKGPPPGTTALDRLHQSMILFAANRGELMKRFLLDDGVGTDPRFWKLAQSLSALYPPGTDEKRWVDGVLARKKGLGL